jgi:transposase-like protein
MIDWTWITRKICLIIYYDYINKKVVRFWFYDWEKYEYIKEDLEVLKNEFKYEIEWFVLDWAKPIIRAVEKIYPEAKIQRCLTHIHRQTRNYLSKNPKTKAWKELKKLITFKAFNNEKSFIRRYNNWEEKYSYFLNERTVNWNDSRYTHRRLRSAKSHIKNAIPYMFHYLNNSKIKKSNNDLEWLNWILNTQINRHKWLRIDRLISFISLWIYERNLR